MIDLVKVKPLEWQWISDGWEPDARLIAAAPDLAAEVLRLRAELAALKDTTP